MGQGHDPTGPLHILPGGADRAGAEGGQGAATLAQVDDWHSVACGLCSRWSRCVVPAQGDDKGPRSLAVGKAHGQPLLGGSWQPPRSQDPCSPLSVARAWASPRRAALAPGPFCSSGVGLPRLCPAWVSLRGAASLAVSHHCSGLLEAVQRLIPLDLVQPEQPKLSSSSRWPSPPTEALAALETQALQTS